MQHILDELKESFLLFGLEISTEKTEMMIMQSKKKHKQMTIRAYDKRITGEGLSSKEHQVLCVSCE